MPGPAASHATSGGVPAAPSAMFTEVNKSSVGDPVCDLRADRLRG